MVTKIEDLAPAEGAGQQDLNIDRVLTVADAIEALSRSPQDAPVVVVVVVEGPDGDLDAFTPLAFMGVVGGELDGNPIVGIVGSADVEPV